MYLPFKLLSFFLTVSIFSQAQPVKYSVSNAHSHNDYEQQKPFWMAYQAGFGSIEADIFLVDSVLYVAHDRNELKRKMNFESEYLLPILSCLQKNNGWPYPEAGKNLQLLIDIKTDSINTLDALIVLLRKYPSLVSCKSLSWVITGNRPDAVLFIRYPDFIHFDGELHKTYSAEALSKISLMSDDFKKYSFWDGKNGLPQSDQMVLINAIKKSHQLQKPVRFWNAPDMPEAWHKLMLLEVDYINTDHIHALAGYLNK